MLENIENKLVEKKNKWQIEMKENMSEIKSSNKKTTEDNRNYVDKIIKIIKEKHQQQKKEWQKEHKRQK